MLSQRGPTSNLSSASVPNICALPTRACPKTCRPIDAEDTRREIGATAETYSGQMPTGQTELRASRQGNLSFVNLAHPTQMTAFCVVLPHRIKRVSAMWVRAHEQPIHRTHCFKRSSALEGTSACVGLTEIAGLTTLHCLGRNCYEAYV